ncbi:MAG: response regulator transcription factor [Chloroflexota bacterium]
MDKPSVLIVDDDPKIRRLVSANLERRNYVVLETSDGAKAIAHMQQETPDLVILDLVMPGISGNEVCIWIREQGLDIPVIVLSAYDEEDLKVRALDSGADDYITKPFQTEEFLARVRALMRRSGGTESNFVSNKIIIAGLTVDPKARRAFVDDVDMHLTRTEFALLATLAQNCDAVLTHDELLARVWGEEYRGSSHYLHVYLGRIRKKLGDQYNVLLETVPGMGYILHSSL